MDSSKLKSSILAAFFLCGVPFPSIRLLLGMKNFSGPFLDSLDSKELYLKGASRKIMYRLILKTPKQNKLNGCGINPAVEVKCL